MKKKARVAREGQPKKSGGGGEEGDSMFKYGKRKPKREERKTGDQVPSSVERSRRGQGGRRLIIPSKGRAAVQEEKEEIVDH